MAQHRSYWQQQGWQQTQQSPPPPPQLQRPGAVNVLQQRLQQQQHYLQQRNAAPTPPAPLAASLGGYVVFTKGNDSEEVVVRTLVGEYIEKGSNHGRKVYQRVADRHAGPDYVDVFMYYWDHRDGPSFEGWWFGNKLGGTQVWSHCNSSDLTPPSTGWKIPWDGTVRPTLCVVAKNEQQKQMAAEKARIVSDEISRLDAPARAALDNARKAAGDLTSPAGLQQAESILAPHAAPLEALVKKVTETQRLYMGDAGKLFAPLAEQVRSLQRTVSGELEKFKTLEAELKDGKLFQEMMPEAVEKANSAEDAVEKASITNEMITAGGDNMEEVQLAVGHTEVAARGAQTAIGEARIFLNAKQAAVKRFESEKVREKAAAELAKLQLQLQEAQVKLNPLKTVRQDFMQRQAAKKIVDEVLEILTPAELECDRAEEAGNLLKGETPSKELLSQAEQALKHATEQLGKCSRVVAQRKAQAAGSIIQGEIGKCEERIKSSEARLAQLRTAHKDAAERITCDLLIQEATEKLTAVQEAVAKVADAEAPFLMGVEELPLEETMTAVQACEEAAGTANTSASICRMFIATKLVESKRFSPSAASTTASKLKELQKQLEASGKRLAELKKGTGERKAKAMMRGAEDYVSKAEELTKRLAEAAAIFEDDSKLSEEAAEELKTASEATQELEKQAAAAIMEARKYITQRQLEFKGKDASVEVSAELIKYQTRTGAAHTEVSKWKKLAATSELRLAAKKLLVEANGKMEGGVEAVRKLGELVAAMDGDESAEKAEEAAKESKETLKSLKEFVESQARSPNSPKAELAKLKEKLEETQKELEISLAVLRERTEAKQVSSILTECEEGVAQAEEAVKKVSDAEAPFLIDGELPAEQAAAKLKELEEAVTASTVACNSAKAAVVTQRAAAKKLAEKAAKACNEGLTKVQERLDALLKTMEATKKRVLERKLAAVKREMGEKTAAVQATVEKAKEVTAAVVAMGKGESEAKRELCEKASAAQKEAMESLDAGKKLALQRQQETRALLTSNSAPPEIGKIFDSLNKLHKEMGAMRAQLREHEQQFIAAKLAQETLEQVDLLEKKMEEVSSAATPLVGDKNLLADNWLIQIMDMLRKHGSEKKVSDEALFKEVGAVKGKLTEAKFSAFISTFPDLCEDMTCIFSPEEVKAAFSYACGDAEGEQHLTLKGFQAQFQRKYVVTAPVSMTDQMAVKSAKNVRKIDPNEVLEALGDPEKDEALGLVRVKVKAEKDSAEGYVTISGNQGTIYLEPCSRFKETERKVEQAVQEMAEAIAAATKAIDEKAAELKAMKSPPTEALMKVKPRVTKVQYLQSALKKKILETQKKRATGLEAEKRRRAETGDRKVAKAILEEHASAGELCDSAEKLLKENITEAAKMVAAQKELASLQEAMSSAQAKLKAGLESIKSKTKGPFAEARSTLLKLKVRMGSCEARCAKQVTALRASQRQAEGKASEDLANAMRTHFQGLGLSVDEIMKEVGSSTEHPIGQEELRAFLTKIPDFPLAEEQLEAGLTRFSSGLSKLTLQGLVQEYLKCVKDIAITTAFDIKEGKTLRKIVAGEVVEVLEPSQIETGTGLPRARCRALLDGKEGWVSLKGNHGTSFLEKCAKPYISIVAEGGLQELFESGSAELRRLRKGEVLELLEGPRKEEARDVMRLRGTAKKDGLAGYVTFQELGGPELFQKKKVLLCQQSVAITSAFEIGASSRQIRKLNVGETLEALEEPAEDAKSSMTRQKVATSDGKEGYVTVTGNQGTAYVVESEKFYVCTAPTPLEAKNVANSAGSKALRTLEEGELFEAVDEPKVEKKEGSSRVKGRSLADGAEGWLTLEQTKPWSLRFKCVAATELGDSLEAEAAKVLRKLEVGEVLEAQDAPVEEASSGTLRVHLRAAKDGLSGFASVRGPAGSANLESLAGAP